MAKDFDLLDANGRTLAEVREHHGARFEWKPETPVTSAALVLAVHATHGAPAAVFRVRVFER